MKRLKYTSRDKVVDSRTDWDRVDAMTDEEVAAAAKADPDNPPLSEEDLRRVKRRRPKAPGRGSE